MSKPLLDWTGHFLTPLEFARVMDRSERTVHWWCESGALLDFNVPHFQDHTRRWWIQLTPDLSRS